MTTTITHADQLALLDENARLSTGVRHDTRAAWIQAARDIAAEGDGTFHSGQIRARVPSWAHGAESGATITGLVRSGRIVWTGQMATLGNTAQRAGSRLVKTYRWTS